MGDDGLDHVRRGTQAIGFEFGRSIEGFYPRLSRFLLNPVEMFPDLSQQVAVKGVCDHEIPLSVQESVVFVGQGHDSDRI